MRCGGQLLGAEHSGNDASKDYEVLTTGNGGEGLWVNAKVPFATQLPAGAPIKSASFQSLPPGWSLIAIGDNLTPREFNAALSQTPLASGVIPVNIVMLWAWSAVQSNWYFYAPSLDGSSGLPGYITSKSYLYFAAKVLDPASGFWVNKP